MNKNKTVLLIISFPLFIAALFLFFSGFIQKAEALRFAIVRPANPEKGTPETIKKVIEITDPNAIERLLARVDTEKGGGMLTRVITAPSIFTASYDPSALTISLNWQSSHDITGGTSTITYELLDISNLASPVFLASTTLTSFSYNISEIGRSYSYSIQAFADDGSSSATTTAVLSVPSFFSSLFFYKDPRLADPNAHLLDISWQNYPFVPNRASLPGWKSAVFYFNQEPPRTSTFDEPVDLWGMKAATGLKVSYPTCIIGGDTIGSAIIFPDIPANCSPNFGGVRNLSVDFGKINEDSRILAGAFPDHLPNPGDFVSVAFYAVNDFNQQVLVAIDKNKYFFQNFVQPHQSPSQPVITSTSFDDLRSKLNIGWSPSTDTDTLDSLITYQMNISSTGTLDETQWQNMGKQLSTSIDVIFPNAYAIGIRAVDEFGNTSPISTISFSFPPGFVPHILSASLISATQDFIPTQTGSLSSIQVFTDNFIILSPNSIANICYLDLYKVNLDNSLTLISANDLTNPADNFSDAYAFRGPSCAGNLTFTYNSANNPIIEANQHYRWHYHLQFSGGVQFFGTNTNFVNGLFSNSSIINAKFVVKSVDGTTISEAF